MYHYDFCIADLLIRVKSFFPMENLYELQPFVVPFDPQKKPDAGYEIRILSEDWQETGNLVLKSEQNAVFSDGKEWHRYFYWVAGSDRRYVLLVQRDEENIIYVQSNRLEEFLQRFRLSAFLSLERVLLKNNAFLLHASVIDWQGRGILFSAPSGTGKSTQAELWHQERGCRVVNGDRGLIRRKDGEFLVYGSPYAGTSGVFTDVSVPIDAIVVLSQGQENRVERLSAPEAFRRLYRESTVFSWDTEFANGITQLLGALVMSVPVFHLTCTPTKEAVCVLEEALME